VKIQKQLTEAFGIEKGLRQSDALSVTLFRIVLEKAIRNKETNPNGTVFNGTRQCIANVDNVFILGLFVRAIKETVTQI
jgi:hypothetical protein